MMEKEIDNGTNKKCTEVSEDRKHGSPKMKQDSRDQIGKSWLAQSEAYIQYLHSRWSGLSHDESHHD